MLNVNIKHLYSLQYYYRQSITHEIRWQDPGVLGFPLPSPTPRRAVSLNWKHRLFSLRKPFLCSASPKCASQPHGVQPGRGRIFLSVRVTTSVIVLTHPANQSKPPSFLPLKGLRFLSGCAKRGGTQQIQQVDFTRPVAQVTAQLFCSREENGQGEEEDIPPPSRRGLGLARCCRATPPSRAQALSCYLQVSRRTWSPLSAQGPSKAGTPEPCPQ